MTPAGFEPAFTESQLSHTHAWDRNQWERLPEPLKLSLKQPQINNQKNFVSGLAVYTLHLHALSAAGNVTFSHKASVILPYGLFEHRNSL
jgi:hypothetical protein